MMSNRLEAYAHLAGQTLRTGWYAALYSLTNRQAARLSEDGVRVEITRPVPSLWALVQDVLKLQAKDARNVRDGYYPIPVEDGGSLSSRIEAVRGMLADLPQSNERRAAKRAMEAASLPEAQGMPDYYAQNFHYQSGGYLTEESAKLYDVQVETLFMGAAGAMRRQAIPPIAEFLKGRDQRQLKLLDVGCGSGRFLGQLAQAFPAMPVTGADLSQAYLDEAARYLHGRRNLSFRQANAEALPFETGSFDIATCIFLYHELPNEVRRKVSAEIARILKPGGLFVFVDSLQWGDVDGYDGLLEAFPQRFHEPYYLDYLGDRLDGPDGVFAHAEIQPTDTFPAFLSKVIVCRRTGG
jgi:ubiquinone/menaquinone biosynthesis C-methylase UbiE